VRHFKVVLIRVKPMKIATQTNLVASKSSERDTGGHDDDWGFHTGAPAITEDRKFQ
jgi:hypothetical protein